MKSKFKKYWENTKAFRESMPELVNPKFIEEFFDLEEGESYIGKINSMLLKYDEIKSVCKITRIKPFYYLLFSIFALSFILIGYFDKYLTIIMATLYPLFMTFKALQNYDAKDSKNKIEVIHWLKYWIFYTVFLIFESFFGNLFRNFYFFFKIIFLIICFKINSVVTRWIYYNCLKIVRTHEKIIVEKFKNIYEHIIGTKKELEKKREERRKRLKKDDKNDEKYSEKIGNYFNTGKAILQMYENY